MKGCIVRCKGDRHNRRWLVRDARSLKDVIDEIAHAMVTGSIGGKSILYSNGTEIVMADVIRVNSDNTEAKPYEQAY